MPINQLNCVRYTVRALTDKYGRNLHARRDSPSDATINRYIRACRTFDRFHDLIMAISEHDIIARIPLIILFARGYRFNKKSDRSSALEDQSPPEIYRSRCPLTTELFNKDPLYAISQQLIFREESPTIPPESDCHPSDGANAAAEAAAPLIKFTFG